MSEASIPVVDFSDWLAGERRRADFVKRVGHALEHVGFFAVQGHPIPEVLTWRAYEAAKQFFSAPLETKLGCQQARARGQRGYTRFGTEHAKDNALPDLKEFWQLARPDVPDDHIAHQDYGPNLWPAVPDFRAAMTELYQALDRLGRALLEAAALYLEEPQDRFAAMAEYGDTIVRVIHYPPLAADTPPGAIRSAAHEDINLITLLSGATAEGLELLERDGRWRPIHSGLDTIVVDAGDMLQNVTNGIFRSTTHRVVNPVDPTQERYSMPCFIHPRKEVDLTPLASCVARRSGERAYPSISAGAYLEQRLREIGLA